TTVSTCLAPSFVTCPRSHAPRGNEGTSHRPASIVPPTLSCAVAAHSHTRAVRTADALRQSSPPPHALPGHFSSRKPRSAHIWPSRHRKCNLGLAVKGTRPTEYRPSGEFAMSNSREVVVLSGVRTAIGGYGGSLKDSPPSELAALCVREAVSRANIEPR